MAPFHGVFFYGPRPGVQRYYGGGPGQPRAAAPVRAQDLPKRHVDRRHSLAMGLRGGAYLNATLAGGGYADPGLGLFLRYRPVGAFGIEVAGQHHVGQRTTHTLGSASGEVFLFSWNKLSPYGLGGLTVTDRGLGGPDLDESLLVGLHAGGGLEIALGRKVALDIEGRYIGYLNRQDDDPAIPGAVTITGGLAYHF